jgi:UDP:flavonoid glycosyltransferase YjiC (YdhE family)
MQILVRSSVTEWSSQMRVLFSSSPFAGHLFPLLPLARAARRAGHDVAVLTSEPLRSALDPGTEVLGAGPMPDVLLGEVARRRGTDPTRDNGPEIVAELFAGARVDLSYDSALGAAERWRPDVIVFEYCDFVGPLVASALGCACARLAYGRAYEPEYDATMADVVAQRYGERGLEPARPLGFLDTCPPSLQAGGWKRPAGHRLLRPEPYSRPGARWTAPDFKGRADLPTVLVTFGTVFSAASALSAVLNGLRDRDVNVIVTVGPTGDPAALGADPSRVHVERFVPLDRLLPSVSCVVSHGGAGTILAGASRGLPLVLLPQGADQFHNAEQVAAVGAGITLLPGEAGAAAIGASVDRALTDPALSAGAARLAREIAAMDPPAAAIASLERQVESELAVVV